MFVYRVIVAHQGFRVGQVIADTHPRLSPYLVPIEAPIIEPPVMLLNSEPRVRRARKVVEDGQDGRVLDGMPSDGTE